METLLCPKCIDRYTKYRYAGIRKRRYRNIFHQLLENIQWHTFSIWISMKIDIYINYILGKI